MSGYFEKLEGFVAAARQLEVALNEEKKTTKKLQDDLRNVHAMYERLLKEAERRNDELNSTTGRLKAALSENEQNDRRNKERYQEYEKVRSELQQYRSAWNDVLQREREAKQGFVAAARQSEVALNEEKKTTKKLQDVLHNAHAMYERLLTEAKSRNNELNFTTSRLKIALSEHERNDLQNKERYQALYQEYEKIRRELQQYRSAWSDVLQREREAKLIIREAENNTQKIADLESRLKTLTESLTTERAQRTQIERQAKSYQMELQNALVRIHSSKNWRPRILESDGHECKTDVELSEVVQ